MIIWQNLITNIDRTNGKTKYDHKLSELDNNWAMLCLACAQTEMGMIEVCEYLKDFLSMHKLNLKY